MGALSKYLRNVAGGGLSFWCEGCGCAHTVWVQGHEPNDGRHRWTWNGEVERPVFGPSVLIRTYRYPHPYEPDANPEHAEIRAKFQELGSAGHDWMMAHPKWGRCCHTFVGCNGAQPGEIIFLGDCTHALAGQVRPLAEMPQHRSREA